MSSGAVTIRPMDHADLPAVARIHVAAFPDGALTHLGVGPIARYYAWQLDGPHDATSVVALRDGRIVGYCVGGVFRGALSGFLRANRAYLAAQVLLRPWLLLTPIVTDRVRVALRLLPRAGAPAPKATGPAALVPASGASPTAPAVPASARHGGKPFGILAIAADPTAGGGIGSALMRHMERTAIDRGFAQMQLTVSPTNVRAVGFYEHLGWQRDPGADGVWAGNMLKAIAVVAGERAPTPLPVPLAR